MSYDNFYLLFNCTISETNRRKIARICHCCLLDSKFPSSTCIRLSTRRGHLISSLVYVASLVLHDGDFSRQSPTPKPRHSFRKLNFRSRNERCQLSPGKHYSWIIVLLGLIANISTYTEHCISISANLAIRRHLRCTFQAQVALIHSNQ